jgi:hydroxymethylbilane synthase
MIGRTDANWSVRIATRGSALARWQAEWVAAQLRARGAEVRLIPVTTEGDRQQQGPVGTIGSRGVFTKEIQAAVLDGRADLAVHSLKDLPTDPVEGLCLAAVPERGPAGDALVCRQPHSLDDLPAGTVMGSGSLRRRAQILHVRPDLRVEPIRGNVDTRLRKLDEGQCDALVLAEAGLRRLGLAERIVQILPLSVVLPAVGQGALGLETRADVDGLLRLLRGLNDPPTEAAVLAERAMLGALQGGCLAPIAAWGRVAGGSLILTGRVLHPDGTKRIETTESGDLQRATELGHLVAEGLLAQGAADLIRASRETG